MILSIRHKRLFLCKTCLGTDVELRQRGLAETSFSLQFCLFPWHPDAHCVASVETSLFPCRSGPNVSFFVKGGSVPMYSFDKGLRHNRCLGVASVFGYSRTLSKRDSGASPCLSHFSCSPTSVPKPLPRQGTSAQSHASTLGSQELLVLARSFASLLVFSKALLLC